MDLRKDYKPSSIIDIRIFKTSINEEDPNAWKNTPITCHMPAMIHGNGDINNINKRIRNLYLQQETDITKIRWNFKGDDANGFWLS